MKLPFFLFVHILAVVLCVFTVHRITPYGHIGILLVFYGMLFIGVTIFYIVFQLFYDLINAHFLTKGTLFVCVFYLSVLTYVFGGIFMII